MRSNASKRQRSEFTMPASSRSVRNAGRAAHLAPAAIGLTLVLNIDMGGALAGAAFNPARALGPMIVTGNLSDAWLYVLAPSQAAIANPEASNNAAPKVFIT
jgi:glycerol uptake facilitator-like aquaporin